MSDKPAKARHIRVMLSRLRCVLVPWRPCCCVPDAWSVERDKRYGEYGQQLLAVLADKDTVLARIATVDGRLAELTTQLQAVLQREAAACEQLEQFWRDDNDFCSHYVSYAWLGHLRTVNARQYVEQTWSSQIDELLGRSHD